MLRNAVFLAFITPTRLWDVYRSGQHARHGAGLGRHSRHQEGERTLLLGGSSLYGIQKMLVGRGLIRDNEDLAHRPALPPAETGAYPVAAPPWAQPWHELRIAAEPLPECAHCLPWTAPGLSITNLEFVPSQDPGWRTASLAMA